MKGSYSTQCDTSPIPVKLKQQYVTSISYSGSPNCTDPAASAQAWMGDVHCHPIAGTQSFTANCNWPHPLVTVNEKYL